MKKTTELQQTKTKGLRQMIEGEKIPRRLGYIYGQVPKANCGPCVKCCFACAQVFSIEYLNIYAYLSALPELSRTRLAKKLLEYEMLHLTTLKFPCPFLENDTCMLEDHKPLLCRLFGLHPEDEYQKMTEESQRQNEQLAMYYARSERVLLPEEVMRYDVDFCSPNLDKKGNPIFVTSQERQRLYQQIYSLSELILPDEWLSPDLQSFSYEFTQFYMTPEEIDKAKLQSIKEFQAGGKSSTLERLANKYGFRL